MMFDRNVRRSFLESIFCIVDFIIFLLDCCVVYIFFDILISFLLLLLLEQLKLTPFPLGDQKYSDSDLLIYLFNCF